MEIAIYFTNGNVAYFKEVSNIKENNERLSFDYFGVASQKHKKAVFFNDKLAGISITKENQ